MQSPLQRCGPAYRRLRLFFLICFLLLFLFTISVLAASGADAGTIKILERLNPSQNGIISYLFRQMGWGLVKFLRYLVNGIETAVYGITSALGGFYESTGVKNLISGKLLPLAVAMLSLVVVFIGIQYLIKPRDTHTIVTNLITGILVAVALPTFLSYGFQLTQAAVDSLGDGKAGSVANQAVLDNTVDLLLYDRNDFSSGKLPFNSFYAKNKDADGLMRVSLVELIDPGDTQHPEVWSNTVKTDSNGEKLLEPIENGLVSSSMEVLTNGYYRWQVDWLTLIVSLSVSAFALLFTSIRIAKILFELAVQQALAQVLGLLDVYSNQRLKKCLQSILGSLVTFFGCFAMLQLYLIGMQYVSSIANLFVKLVCMLALALLLINGPSIFEQLFGQNLGGQKGGFVSTVFGLQAMMGLATTAKRGVVGTKGPDGKHHGGILPTASQAVGGVATAASAGIGAAAGSIHGIKAARVAGASNRSHKQDTSPAGTNDRAVPPSLGVSESNPILARQDTVAPPSGPAALSQGSQKGPDSFSPSSDQPNTNLAEDTTSSSVVSASSSIAHSTQDYHMSPFAPRPDAARSPYSSVSNSNPTEIQGSTLGQVITGKVRRGIEESRPMQAAGRSYVLSYNTAGKIAAKKQSVHPPAISQQPSILIGNPAQEEKPHTNKTRS